MKKLLFLLAFIPAVASFGQTATKDQTYGDKITAEGAVPAAKVSEKMKQLDSLQLKVTGTVSSVCQKKGCWMQMDIGGGKTMRVTFKDYAFFVPKNISGKTVIVDGYAYKNTTSVAQLRHYAQDAGKSKAEIEKITQPETSISYEARGVIIKE